MIAQSSLCLRRTTYENQCTKIQVIKHAFVEIHLLAIGASNDVGCIKLFMITIMHCYLCVHEFVTKS